MSAAAGAAREVAAERSARGRSNRNRGAEAERKVASFLRANGYPDARRYLAGDGKQPGDIDFHPLVCVEVKDQASSAWPSWCRQAASEARDGMVPVVVRRTRGVADAGLWECRVQWNGWVVATGSGLFGAMGGTPTIVDHRQWTCTTLAEFTAALRRFDAVDGAA